MIVLLYLFHKYWKKLKTNQILIYIILKIFVKKNSIFVRLNFTYGYNDRNRYQETTFRKKRSPQQPETHRCTSAKEQTHCDYWRFWKWEIFSCV